MKVNIARDMLLLAAIMGTALAAVWLQGASQVAY